MSTVLVPLAILMGLVTYPWRAVPLLAPGIHRLPTRLQEYLRLVGPAVLAALAAVDTMVVLDAARHPSFHVGPEWIAVGLCVLAEPAVLLLLGEQWRAAIPLVRLLALNAMVGVWLSTAHHVNLAVGMARSTTIVLALHAALSLPLMLWLVPSFGAEGAVCALLVASLCTAPANFVLLGKAIAFRMRDAAAMIWRPLAGSLAMSGVLFALLQHLGWPQALPMQLVCVVLLVAIGAVVYAATVMLCWALRRNADSAEAWLVERTRAFLRSTALRAARDRPAP